ncbi:MAG TPA: CopG family transcriptional regulator [Gallicola sp.]|nr:CopG family transcriptional regulator [Gallicola sp.]
MIFKKKKTVLVNFRLDEMLVEMIDKAGQINDMSRSEIIRQILADYFRKEIITKNYEQ